MNETETRYQLQVQATQMLESIMEKERQGMIDLAKRTNEEKPDFSAWCLEMSKAIGVRQDKFNNEPSRQTVMFAGMDCLPGQMDLFDTDEVK